MHEIVPVRDTDCVRKAYAAVRRRKLIGGAIYHLFVIAAGCVMIYPLVWMIMSSFKPADEIFRSVSLLPREFMPQNYITGWKGFGGITFSTFMANSFFITTCATVGAVLSSAVVAYGFARCRFRFKKVWFSAMLVTMMLPFQVIMIPQFIIFQKLHMVGTVLPLILPNFFGMPFGIFLTMQFIQGIPRELDDAAKIDGCSLYKIFTRIIVPLIVPALVTTGIFAFMWKWDDFLGALLYLNNPERYPVCLALKMFCDPSAQSDWGAMFAMSTLSILPILLIFIVCQKYLIEGISTSGLKS